MIGGLYDGVFFGMIADAVAEIAAGGGVGVGAWAAAGKTVGNAAGGSVVAGGDDALIFYDDGGDLPSGTVASGSDYTGNFEKVGVPIRTCVCIHGDDVTRWCGFRQGIEKVGNRLEGDLWMN